MKKNILILLVTTLVACSCDSLVKSIELKEERAGSNLLEMSVKDFVLMDHSEDLTNLNLYALAIRRAGLESELEKDDITVFIPHDQAMKEYLGIIGYSDVVETPVPVLRNALLGTIIQEKTKSTDLELNTTKEYISLNGDPIYLTRETTDIDAYILRVNNPSLVATPVANVRTQNLQFKNGMAHVVESVPYFGRVTEPASPVDFEQLEVEAEEYQVAKDVFVRPGSFSDLNHNHPSDILVKGGGPEFARIGLFQFLTPTPSFGKRIGSATFNVRGNYLEGDVVSTPVSVYLAEQIDWQETIVSYSTSPKQIGAPLFTRNVYKADMPGYVEFDITDALSNVLDNSYNFINLCLVNTNTSNMYFFSREFNQGNSKAYIRITSPPESILKLGTANDIFITEGKQHYILSKNDIEMLGADDYDIFFSLRSPLQHGYLLKSGVPIKVNEGFSQQDISNGNIKFLSETDGEHEIVLEARDFQGGYYKDLITITVHK